MKAFTAGAALAASLVLASTAQAQVNFNTVVSITQELTVAEVETALSAASTFRIDGVALGPAGTIFIVHASTTGAKTIARFDATAATPTALYSKSTAQLKADLGGVYASEATFPILVSELVWDPSTGTNGTLYFADESTVTTGEYAVLRLNLDTNVASEVRRNNDIAGWNSFGVLASGNLVGALGEEHEVLTGGEPQVGSLNVTSGVYTEVADVDDFIAKAVPALGPTDELPPETIAVNPANNDVYVFGHDNFRIFRVTNFESVTFNPATDIAQLNIPEWNGGDLNPGFVDLHGLAVDEDGNVYGFDEGNEAIVIWNGTDTFDIPLDDITTAIGGTVGVSDFEPTLWRGLKARKVNATQSEVWLSSGTDDYGVVRIILGNGPLSVANWQMFQ